MSAIARDGGRCRRCGIKVTSGRKSNRSAVVDHIVPHGGDRALFFDPSNVWTLCKQDHDVWKAQVEGRRGSSKRMQRDDGWDAGRSHPEWGKGSYGHDALRGLD